MGRPGGRWKAESQGFPTATIRASENITSSSYGRFDIVPPPAGILLNSLNRAASGGNSLKLMKLCRLRRKFFEIH